MGSEVTVVRSLRLGGPPWLLRADGRNVVLRVAGANRASSAETEVAAMSHVTRADPGVPVAEVLGYDLAEKTGYALLLIGELPGSSVIPAEPDPGQLRALGAIAARISAVAASPSRALPVRRRPIEGEDFGRMRREQGTWRTGTWSRRSRPRRTWAGSPSRWPPRAARPDPGGHARAPRRLPGRGPVGAGLGPGGQLAAMRACGCPRNRRGTRRRRGGTGTFRVNWATRSGWAGTASRFMSSSGTWTGVPVACARASA